MLCFNYIANIIKLMGLLSREGMRDGDIGICWDAGHIGICGICGEDGGYAGYAGRTTSPKSARPGCRFFGPPPPLAKAGDRNGKRSTSRKNNAYFVFNLLIINNIN